ncbi:MAG: sorbitol dehydrogenase [Acidobacteriota bacterium]
MTTAPSTGGPSPSPSDSVIQDFADMSAALTGFQSSFLRPFIDPVNLSGTFYSFASSQAGQSMMDALLEAFRAIQSESAQTIADTLLEVSSDKPSNQALLCRAIVAMWYLGSWYPPPFQTDGLQQVISAQAYTMSLAWNVAQAHPMGYSVFQFGYWSEAPKGLETFGVNMGNGVGQ